MADTIHCMSCDTHFATADEFFNPEHRCFHSTGTENFPTSPMFHDEEPGPFDDPFDDDTPLVCGIDNPDYCESCM